MPTYKGGRGVRAPYQSITMRVPVPIKDKVQELVDDYKNDADVSIPQILDIEAAINLSRNILKNKKGARDSMQKLLMGIYGKEVNL